MAEATDAETDPDRRAWHLAEATAGPDEAVAGELERAAGRAQARGGLAAAAAFLAARRRVDAGAWARVRAGVAAAQTKYEAGALDDALALLATAGTGGVDDLQRARVNLLRAQIAFAVQRGGDAPSLLLEAARELEAVDPDRARTTYLEALEAARFAGPLARGADVVDVSRAALACPAPHRPPRPTDLLLQGMATMPIDGHAAAVPILKAALSAFRREEALPPDESRWLSLACRAAWDVFDEESWRLLVTRELQRARDAGALTVTPLLLTSLSYLKVLCGELSTVESLLDEIRATTAATGIPAHRYVEIWVAALRGREPELSALVEDFTTDARARGEGFALAFAGQAGAVLYNSLGRYEEAFAAVREAVDVAPYSELSTPSAVAELTEAAARAGEFRIAERALERLTLTTRPSGSDWALGVEARSRALLSDGDDAERLYQEAIERLRRTRVRVQLARTHLLYGEWLRRERRRLVAREQLRTALEMFGRMDVEGFAGRAERELLATGERAASAPWKRARRSPPRKLRLPGWPAMAFRTPQSASGCSSASTRSPTTCARSSPSSTSPRATSSAECCPRAPIAGGWRSRHHTISRLRTSDTPGTRKAIRSAASRSDAISTAPHSVTFPPSTSTSMPYAGTASSRIRASRTAASVSAAVRCSAPTGRVRIWSSTARTSGTPRAVRTASARWSRLTTLPRSTTSPSSWHSTAISAMSTCGAPASASMIRPRSARSDKRLSDAPGVGAARAARGASPGPSPRSPRDADGVAPCGP